VVTGIEPTRSGLLNQRSRSDSQGPLNLIRIVYNHENKIVFFIRLLERGDDKNKHIAEKMLYNKFVVQKNGFYYNNVLLMMSKFCK